MRYPWNLFAILTFASTSAVYAAGEAKLKSVLIDEGRGEPAVRVDFSISEVAFTKASDSFSEVEISGLEPLAEIGKPNVLTTGVLLAVPEGYSPQVSVIEESKQSYPHLVLAPYQRKVRCGGGDKSSYVMDQSVYQSTVVYPQTSYRLEDVGHMQNLHMVRLAINPIQMDFANQSVVVSEKLSLRVDFVPSLKGVRKTELPSTFAEIARKLTVNAGSSKSIRASESPEKMLIVVADDLEAEMSSYIEWKRARGLQVDVVKFSAAGGSKEAVQTYIQKYYDQSAAKPTYLLLVGNGTTMPTFMRSTSSGSAASDYVFALLSGNDILPDILVGRLVADNAAEVQTQVSRWIKHERHPEVDAEWYAKGTTIASREGSNPSDVQYAEQIQGEMTGHTYSLVDKFYEGTGQATAVNIVKALEEGRSWLTYIGHGSGTSWGSTNTPFSNATIQSLKNFDRLPVIVDVACLNGSFVKFSKCFGKQWVTHSQDGHNAGAVSYYGASVSTSWHEPAVMAVGATKRHYENKITSLGGTVLAGQLYLVEKMGTGANVVDNLEWYNLLGDPSLAMRTAKPNSFELTYSVFENSDGLRVDVLASGDSAGVKVALVGPEGRLLGFGTTDAHGELSLPVAAKTDLAGSKLTGTGYNYETREVELQ